MHKNWKLLFVSCALVIGGLGGSALARGGGRGGMVKKFDENGDGKLDDAERAKLKAARAKRKAEMVARYDRNTNGVLDPAEKQAMHDDRAAERFKRLDKDGDGKLSPEEFRAGGRHKRGGDKQP